MRFELINDDCRNVLACMADDSVDSVVTDPPYHLTSIVKRFGPGAKAARFGTNGAFSRASRGFMGQEWDGGDIAFDPSLWAEILRVLKPGGHVAAFGGSRNFHRMACAIEDSGCEIRDEILYEFDAAPDAALFMESLTPDQADAFARLLDLGQFNGLLAWVYASGMPKALDVAKAGGNPAFEGWKSAIKPAHEPIYLARKPLVGSIADNMARYGVGALNVDACRIDAPDGVPVFTKEGARPGTVFSVGSNRTGDSSFAGRFPSNVVHSGDPAIVAAFPKAKSGGGPKPGTPRTQQAVYGAPTVSESPAYGSSTGSAARFFYCAKASNRDRDEGCEALRKQPAGMVSETSGRHVSGADVADRANIHPTVKPTSLMRWLVRLITPPGGTVFDPFTGSGSTGKAALLEGARFIGAEMTADYIPIATARLQHAAGLTGQSC